MSTNNSYGVDAALANRARIRERQLAETAQKEQRENEKRFYAAKAELEVIQKVGIPETIQQQERANALLSEEPAAGPKASVVFRFFGGLLMLFAELLVIAGGFILILIGLDLIFEHYSHSARWLIAATLIVASVIGFHALHYYISSRVRKILTILAVVLVIINAGSIAMMRMEAGRVAGDSETITAAEAQQREQQRDLYEGVSHVSLSLVVEFFAAWIGFFGLMLLDLNFTHWMHYRDRDKWERIHGERHARIIELENEMERLTPADNAKFRAKIEEDKT